MRQRVGDTPCSPPQDNGGQLRTKSNSVVCGKESGCGCGCVGGGRLCAEDLIHLILKVSFIGGGYSNEFKCTPLIWTSLNIDLVTLACKQATVAELRSKVPVMSSPSL